MSPAAVGRNPDGRDSRQIVVLPSLLKTLVIEHKQHQKCVLPNFPAPDLRSSLSPGFPSLSRKLLFLGKMATEIYLFWRRI